MHMGRMSQCTDSKLARAGGRAGDKHDRDRERCRVVVESARGRFVAQLLLRMARARARATIDIVEWRRRIADRTRALVKFYNDGRLDEGLVKF